MNKTLKFLVAGVSAACAFGATAEETAFQGQPIGSIAVSNATRSAIVAVAFKELSADESQNVSVSNILSTVNLQTNDQVFVYMTNTSTYASWILKGTENDLYWEKVQNVSQGQGGDQSSSPGLSAAEGRPGVGEGFWLIRQQNSQTNRNYSLPFYVFGAAVTNASTTEAVGVAGTKVLMANPTMQKKSPTIFGMAGGDTIQMPIAGGGLRPYRYDSDKKKWCWSVGLTPYAEDNIPAVDPGVGFWYTKQGAETVTFTW